MNVIFEKEKQNVPIYNWASHIDDNTIEQAQNIASHPYIFDHVSLMPDAHLGSGACIGSVFATKDCVIPAAVGVDIGCGMCALKTKVKVPNKEILQNIGKTILNNIPLGFGSYEKPQEWEFFNHESVSNDINEKIKERAPFQLGTLGGGNHFIEFQSDDYDNLWIMLHSGSRNIGLQIANYWIKKSKQENENAIDKNLSHLSGDDIEGYINDMNWALKYAFENRKRLMFKILKIVENVYSHNNLKFKYTPSGIINIHHNYANLETWNGKKVWVHRKGATLASETTIGIIPGSMGTFSYIVRGLGNVKSFHSCSHGAGRKFSRRKAKELFEQKEIDKDMENSEILVFVKGQDYRDECKGAYKNIDIVMEDQKDLIQIIKKLKPKLVVKG